MTRNSRSDEERPPSGPFPTPEFSRPIELAELPAGGQRWTLEASAEECAALARRFDLGAIESLQGVVRVMPLGGAGGYWVEGRVEAHITQRCVVSLEPFDVDVADSFRIELRPAEDLEDGPGVAEDEDVEPLEGSTLDLGELLAQHLSLALDPHPRKPGAALAWTGPRAGTGEEKPQNPFAALGALKRKM